MAAFQQVLFDSLVILLFVMGIVSAVVGVGLVVCSAKMFRLFAVMNRYVSTRKSLKQASIPKNIEPLVQRHRLWFAAAIIAGSVYSFYYLTAGFSIEVIVDAVAVSNVFMISLIEALRWFMVVMDGLALMAGILLGFFPDVLNKVESHANRWYSIRRATAGADDMYLTLDQWVEAFPRVAGLAITLGALIMIVCTGVNLF